MAMIPVASETTSMKMARAATMRTMGLCLGAVGRPVPARVVRLLAAGVTRPVPAVRRFFSTLDTYAIEWIPSPGPSVWAPPAPVA